VQCLKTTAAASMAAENGANLFNTRLRFIGIGDNQGGQIGRIFAHWVIVYIGQFFEN
jgi:hypothetical protein